MKPQVLTSQPTTEGAGVRIRRAIGTQQLRNLDPFLMLDYFDSDRSADYLAGFPSHPHRGFITFTYMLDGRMEHQDSMGHKGVIGPGDAQWMKAARGVIHSEMPSQIEGRMAGFQLWINLPSHLKLSDPDYQEVTAAQIPVIDAKGAKVKVVAGAYEETQGAVQDPVTDVCFWDVDLDPVASFGASVDAGRVGFVFVYDGGLRVADQTLTKGQMAWGLVSTTEVKAGAGGARFIVVSGQPIGESIVQAGPFVMNSEQEIRQAIVDYQRGRLTV